MATGGKEGISHEDTGSFRLAAAGELRSWAAGPAGEAEAWLERSLVLSTEPAGEDGLMPPAAAPAASRVDMNPAGLVWFSGTLA